MKSKTICKGCELVDKYMITREIAVDLCREKSYLQMQVDFLKNKYEGCRRMNLSERIMNFLKFGKKPKNTKKKQ